jgi:hypothetical protein
MTKLCRALVLIALGLAPAAGVEAATLFSAPLNNATGFFVRCFVVNISGQTRDVTLEIISVAGITQVGPSTVALPSGTGTSLTSSSGAFQYCKLTVEGGKSTVRATFTVEENVGGGDAVTIATTPLE